MLYAHGSDVVFCSALLLYTALLLLFTNGSNSIRRVFTANLGQIIRIIPTS